MDKWLISVASWGEIIFVGTEEEAETFLEHKTEWEGSAGLMRPALPDDLMKHRFIYGDSQSDASAEAAK